jgi:hypothetical protein
LERGRLWELDQVRKVELVKLFCLAHEFGITESNDERFWFCLALKLAQTYHPGFIVKREKPFREGRPRKIRASEIFDEVTKRRVAGLTVKAACNQIVSQRPDLVSSGSDPISEIKSRYYEERRKRSALR